MFHRIAQQQRSRTQRCIRHLTANASNVRDHLRTLLRDTAQPVAVVTALMDPTIPSSSSSPTRTEPAVSPTHNSASRFHGATLSSFSSISMDPHPLVAFSLRIPSRMASSLTAAQTSTAAPVHMVINVLSSRQVSIAVRFSRPDLHPTPFVALPHTLTPEGLPVLDGSVGAMSCRLIAASWPLHDLQSLTGGDKEQGGKPVWEGEGVASELFIAQVVRVEQTSSLGEDARPLLYHRRGYVTTCGIEPKARTSS